MDEQNEVQAFYSGIEPVDVGTLDDVKEQRQAIPATKNVKMKVKKAEIKINKDNTYRSINLQLQIVDGIGDEGKYKNKVVFGRVCYYADPNVYTKDFFKNKQHLVQLKYLRRAIGLEVTTVDGHLIDQLNESSPLLLADIIVKKGKMMVDDGTGVQVEQETLDNEVRNFKPLPLESIA